MEHIGKRIKAERQIKGWDQPELGRRIGLTKSSISQWELEKTNPTAHNTLDVAAALQVSFRYLITGKGSKIPTKEGLSARDMEWLAFGLDLDDDDREACRDYIKAFDKALARKIPAKKKPSKPKTDNAADI